MANLRDLETALVLTEAMLQTAREEDWDRLVELEAVRRAHIGAAFSGPLSGPGAPQFAAFAQRILALDRELIALGEQGRRSLGEALTELRAGRRARAAYVAGAG